MRSYIKLFFVLLLVLLPLNQALAESEPVNLKVVDADVRDVLTALATVGGVNIVADDSVTGKITLDLKDVPFESALDIVTRTKGLSYQKIDNTIVVASAEKLNKGFGSLQIFKLVYANANDVKKSLSALITEERLKVDDATNSILFNGTPKEAEQIKKVLTQLDIPYKQISLEAEVVAVTKSATKDLGVDWTWNATPTYPTETPAVYTPVYDSNGNVVNEILTTPATVTRPNNTGVIQYGRNPEGIPYEFQYQAQISALVTNGKAKILAKPNITTLDGKEANILIGDRIPVQVTTTQNGQTSTSINYVDAGIKLKYTPRINVDGLITATVHTEVSTPTLVSQTNSYRISTREAETNVRVHDGETMVIAGLIGSDESGGNNKVPFLGDFPILGSLFRSTHTVKDETEVMIFLTAHIVSDTPKVNK